MNLISNNIIKLMQWIKTRKILVQPNPSRTIPCELRFNTGG